MTNIKDNAIVQELLNKIAKQDADLFSLERDVRIYQSYC